MWNSAQIFNFLKQEYPALFDLPMTLSIDHIEENNIIISAKLKKEALRPGNIISGPTIMTLADLSFYALLLAKDEKGAKYSLTTSINVNFMRKSNAPTILAQAKIIKYGKTLIIGDIFITDPQDIQKQKPIAHATITYYNAKTHHV